MVHICDLKDDKVIKFQQFVDTKGIAATLQFKDGKIIKHTNNFNLYHWAQQAFGLTGYLIGWTTFFKKKLQTQTNAMLFKYEKRS